MVFESPKGVSGILKLLLEIPTWNQMKMYFFLQNIITLFAYLNRGDPLFGTDRTPDPERQIAESCNSPAF
jgi:hypothetical protein